MSFIEAHKANAIKFDELLRQLVREGDLSLDTYLLKCLKINPDYLEESRKELGEAIFADTQMSADSEERVMQDIEEAFRKFDNLVRSEKFLSDTAASLSEELERVHQEQKEVS